MQFLDVLMDPETATQEQPFNIQGRSSSMVSCHIVRLRRLLCLIIGIVSGMAKVLTIYLAFGATKPRDKIFTLLGFTDSFANLNHVIDYDRKRTRTLIICSRSPIIPLKMGFAKSPSSCWDWLPFEIAPIHLPGLWIGPWFVYKRPSHFSP